MSIITYTRKAKCTDCKFFEAFTIGKMKRHRCDNFDSPNFKQQRTVKDLVCDFWKYLFE